DTPALLEAELAAAKRAGLTDATLVPRLPVGRGDLGPALRFPRQGRFHILKYLDGLARAIERMGGRIFGGSKVDRVEGGTPAMVTTAAGFTVGADDVAVCTNSPISDMMVTHVKMAPYRTFVVALRVPKGSVPDALYWDTPDPYHYIRLQPLDATSDALIVGGEDHKTAHEDDAGERFDCLVEWTREHFPMAAPGIASGATSVSPIAQLIAQWSGQVMETHDYTAFIGRNPDGAEHVWLATGDSGMGMTHGTIAGILLPALMAMGTHRWEKIFDPKRVTLHGSELLEMAKENADVALQYADYLTPGQVSDPKSIPLGEGRVLRRGAAKVAVYKDPAGVLHECSAVCTHMKGIVDWNSAEKSWDCPCHGSRFDRFGKVVNGPATADLEKL
ncbi:MAG: dependent oxidoreductase, partial [Gemmatimonadetes bacterium]|nr:dependent oxidoreductase [Gemmatimonadota bacterium]